jgi:hypothetical protein
LVAFGDWSHSEIGRSLGNSGIGRSEIGRSKIGRSKIGRSEIGRLEIGRSENGSSEIGWCTVNYSYWLEIDSFLFPILTNLFLGV